MPSSEVSGAVLLSKHNGQGDVLSGGEQSESQEDVGVGERRERGGWAEDSEHQPMHGADTLSGSGGV